MNRRITILSAVLASLLLTLLAAGCGGGGDPVNAGPVPWDGAYSGTYTGSEQGTFTFRIGTNGSITATANSPSVGTFPLTGTVTASGNVSIGGSGIGGGYTITYTGTLVGEKPDITGSGTWTSTSGYTGTWSGARTGD